MINHQILRISWDLPVHEMYMLIYHLIQTHCWWDIFTVNFGKWHNTFIDLDVQKYFLTYIWHWTFHDLDLFMMRYKRERSKSSSSVVSLSYEVIWMQQPSRLSGGKSPPQPLYHPNFTPTHSLFAQYPVCSSTHPLKFYSPFKSRIYFILTINSLLKTV